MERRDPLTGPPSVVERLQSMSASAWRPRVEQDIARRKAINEREDAAWQQRVAAQNQAREEERQALVDQRAAQLKAFARERFLRTPASREEDFEAAWPAILREIQIREVTATLSDPVTTMAKELREARRQGGWRYEPGAADFVEVEDS